MQQILPEKLQSHHSLYNVRRYQYVKIGTTAGEVRAEVSELRQLENLTVLSQLAAMAGSMSGFPVLRIL